LTALLTETPDIGSLHGDLLALDGIDPLESGWRVLGCGIRLDRLD
jgi:hypothetical protein